MIFATAPLTTCILSLILIRSALMDRYGPLISKDQPAENFQHQIEDEADYAPLSYSGEIQDYDWSPPNGELPNDNPQESRPLSAYFDENEDLRESWIDQDKRFLVDAPKLELKRGFDYPRTKKNQVLCRVQRAIHHHSESGHEFFPKSYTSYSCHPVSNAQVEGSLATSHDTCYVTGDNCITIEKEQLFLKRRHNTNCWTHFIEAVGAGCKCLSRKY